MTLQGRGWASHPSALLGPTLPSLAIALLPSPYIWLGPDDKGSEGGGCGWILEIFEGREEGWDVAYRERIWDISKVWGLRSEAWSSHQWNGAPFGYVEFGVPGVYPCEVIS